MLSFKSMRWSLHALTIGLSILTMVATGCQYSGSFDGTRCARDSECSDSAQCVDGYCVGIDETAAATLEVTPGSSTLEVGETTELTATPRNASGEAVDPEEIEWASSDSDVASVDAGVVTALAPGAVAITASVPGASATATLTVVDVPAASIELTPESVELAVGESESIEATVLDADAQVLDGREVRFESADSTVAIVTSDGEVVATGPGTTILNAASAEASGSASVTVSPADVASIELRPSNLEIVEGDQYSLATTVRDSNNRVVDNPTLEWSTSDDTVVAVDDGQLTAVAEGVATITAEANGVDDTTEVTVVRPSVASIDLSPAAATLQTGLETSLTARPLASDGSELSWPTVTWSSDDPTTASVDANGTVTAVQPGTAVISAEADGVVRISVITVIERQPDAISISPQNAGLEVGQTTKLDATVLDAAGAPIADPVVIWESGDNAIAVVDSTGEVLGVRSSNVDVQITATTPDGKVATAAIAVSQRSVDAIQLGATSATIEETQTLALTPTLRASDGTLLEGRTVSWSSDNNGIASVDANGVVTAEAQGGPATITATSGGASATIDITVSARSVDRVEVSPRLTNVQAGQTVPLSATALAADGTALTGRTPTWSSDDPLIATVDTNGVVTAEDVGLVLIDATVATETGSAGVRVDPAPVANIAITQANQTLATGSSAQLDATLTDSDGNTLSGRTIAWSSNDTAVAVADSSGLVTGIGGGQATITAASEGQSASILVDVTANSAPTASSAAVSTDEDTSLGIVLTGSDEDHDNSQLIYSLESTPANGALSGFDSTTGAVTYTPDPDLNGTDTFDFTVTDPSGASDTATITITVDPVNDAPVAIDDSATTDEQTSITVDLIVNDTDVDGDSLSVDSLGAAANGAVVDNLDGTVTYDPDADFFGTDTFSYVVTDGTAPDTASVSITVNPVNDTPVAVDDSATTDEDTAVTINLLVNDTDADGDALSVTTLGTPGNGQVTDNGDGTVTYMPDADFNGTDTFGYDASDGSAADSATVSVTVSPVNDAPVAGADAAATDEDLDVTISVLGNDTDPEGDPLTVLSIDTTPGDGTATIAATDDEIIYSPDANFHGRDFLIYTVSDGNGGTDSIWVELTVNPVNDAPVATNDTVTTDEDSSITVNVLDNDTDLDGDALSVINTNDGADGTVVANADGTVTYTPNLNYNGADSFTYEISDPDGATNTASVAVTVNAVNDPPAADAGPNQYQVGNSTSVQLDGSASSDAEGDPLTYAWVFVQNPNGATLSDPSIANPTFNTANNGFGPATYELELTVSDGTLSSTDSVVISTD